jgi:hypothetical protein
MTGRAQPGLTSRRDRGVGERLPLSGKLRAECPILYRFMSLDDARVKEVAIRIALRPGRLVMAPDIRS